MPNMDKPTQDAKVKIFQATGIKANDNDPLVTLIKEITSEVDSVNMQIQHAKENLQASIKKVYLLLTVCFFLMLVILVLLIILIVR